MYIAFYLYVWRRLSKIIEGVIETCHKEKKKGKQDSFPHFIKKRTRLRGCLIEIFERGKEGKWQMRCLLKLWYWKKVVTTRINGYKMGKLKLRRKVSKTRAINTTQDEWNKLSSSVINVRMTEGTIK